MLWLVDVTFSAKLLHLSKRFPITTLLLSIMLADAAWEYQASNAIEIEVKLFFLRASPWKLRKSE